MSRFFRERFDALEAYVPGEQPKEREYIKLNTNECPYPPSLRVREAAKEAARTLNLYNDPEIRDLRSMLAERYGVGENNIVVTNGSDEILYFSMNAFCESIVFPDITYGFYPVFSEVLGIRYRTIPLREDFSVDPEDYISLGENIVIANPNAPTGLALPLSDIERIVSSNPDHVVIIDEAYIDYGGETAIPLIRKYDNLMVTRTFSKSRGLAGARVGFGIASEKLIEDINTMRYSMNPYNVNSMSQGTAIASLMDDDIHRANVEKTKEIRDGVKEELRKMGFRVTDSCTNFLFAESSTVSGEEYYRKLRENGILVRYFGGKRIENRVRISIGTEEQMKKFIEVTGRIVK